MSTNSLQFTERELKRIANHIQNANRSIDIADTFSSFPAAYCLRNTCSKELAYLDAHADLSFQNAVGLKEQTIERCTHAQIEILEICGCTSKEGESLIDVLEGKRKGAGHLFEALSGVIEKIEGFNSENVQDPRNIISSFRKTVEKLVKLGPTKEVNEELKFWGTSIKGKKRTKVPKTLYGLKKGRQKQR